MSMRKLLSATKVLVVAVLFLTLGRAKAEDPVPGGSGTAVGGEIDLLPVVLSADAGRLGGGTNLRIGRDRVCDVEAAAADRRGLGQDRVRVLTSRTRLKTPRASKPRLSPRGSGRPPRR